MKRFAVIGVLLFALVVSPAQARPFEAAEEVAYAEAVAYWAAAPSLCGEVIKTVEPLAYPEAGGAATEPIEFTPVCTLQINPTATAYPGRLCLYMTHEVGHLLGLSHSPDPDSVMYFSPELTAVPRCLELEEAHNEALYLEGRQRRFVRCRNIASVRPRTPRLQKRVEWCWMLAR